MKIVIDDKIPYIREALALITPDVRYLGGAAITADDVRDADALIVRTRTRCDERLLGGSRVSFVATATIGFDHIDTAYMERAGITWTNCPGCNAGSVAQYVRSVLLLLERDFSLPLRGATLGIVGCGHVGRRVMAAAEALGMRFMVCDPPLEEAASRSAADAPVPITHAPSPEYFSLEEISAEADVITFHVPLTTDGPHPTRHLASDAFFRSLRRRPFVINTSRGGVVDERALTAALDSGAVRQAVIDTWEHEPAIDLSLLNKVYIGTPHIAGYSADGKVNADNMVIEALCRRFSLPCPPPIAPPPLPEDCGYDGSPLSLYDPTRDSERLKHCPPDFERLRGDYPLRRETADMK